MRTNTHMNQIEFLMKVLNCSEGEANFYLEELCMMGTEGFEEVYDVDLEKEQLAWAKSFNEEDLLDGDKKFIEQDLYELKSDIRADFWAVGDDY